MGDNFRCVCVRVEIRSGLVLGVNSFPCKSHFGQYQEPRIILVPTNSERVNATDYSYFHRSFQMQTSKRTSNLVANVSLTFATFWASYHFYGVSVQTVDSNGEQAAYEDVPSEVTRPPDPLQLSDPETCLAATTYKTCAPGTPNEQPRIGYFFFRCYIIDSAHSSKGKRISASYLWMFNAS